MENENVTNEELNRYVKEIQKNPDSFINILNTPITKRRKKLEKNQLKAPGSHKFNFEGSINLKLQFEIFLFLNSISDIASIKPLFILIIRLEIYIFPGIFIFS